MKIGKRKFIFFALLIIFIIGIWFFYAHKSSKVIATPTVSVTKGSISEEAEAVGYIKPAHISTIKSQIGGTVSEIYHDEGDFVKKGAPLIKINPTPSPTDYATAYQAVAKAKVDMISTKSDYLRLHDALKDGVISKNYQQYIQAKQAYNAAKVALSLAKQRLALLKQGKTLIGGKEIENTVTTPISGYILTRAVEIGDPVISISAAQASTTLYTIANMSDLMFSGTVDERDAAKIKDGMQGEITVGSMSDHSIPGVLTKISLQSDKENTAQGVASANADSTSPFNVGFSIEITKLKIPPSVTLRSGYSATAKINIKTLQNVLLLPERVLQFEDGKPYVMVEKTGSEKAEKTFIKIGIADGMKVEIKSGLKLGDKILDASNNGNGDQNGSRAPRPGNRR